MIRSFFCTKEWFLHAYGIGAALLISLYMQVSLSVKLNDWYKGFYDILQNIQAHTYDQFIDKLADFAYIAVPYVLLATVTGFVTRIYALKWREAMTFSYIPKWRLVKKDIEGASQRIQEDTYRFARLVETLGLQFVKALMTLIAFLPILWHLSSSVKIPYIGSLGSAPGSLVWIAIIVSLGGTVISWFVGVKLPGLEYNNQKVEAAFRKELVLAEDNKMLYGSEETLVQLFSGIKLNYRRLFYHYGYFDIWANFFGQVMVIVPFLICGQSLFAGAITLGVLIQINNAFEKVYGSFSILIDNWTSITELRSIRKRLCEFENNLKISSSIQE